VPLMGPTNVDSYSAAAVVAITYARQARNNAVIAGHSLWQHQNALHAGVHKDLCLIQFLEIRKLR